MDSTEHVLRLPAGLPYDPFRDRLYTCEELLEGARAGDPYSSLDGRIERHVLEHGFRAPPALEALAQRLHDHAIDVALSELLARDTSRGVVGIMGSAVLPRTDPWYRRVAELAWRLARAGYLVASGGGPGAMEAANLGAFLAANDDPAAVDEALAVLARHPRWEDDRDGYAGSATEVRRRFSPGAGSIAIPTWFYPGEPLGQFASHIAKYFANSIREAGLLSIAVSGVVFAPGRAGTFQELFQDAAQNAYGIAGVSPMVLFGREYDAEPSVYALLRHAAARFGGFQDLVGLCDEPAEVVEFIEAHPSPEAVAGLVGTAPEVLSFMRNERMRAR